MPKSLRILDFDTENRPGFYWYDDKSTDMMMCISWKFIDEDDDVMSILAKYNRTDGLHMPSLLPFYKALASADIVTGHNIRRHDIPLLNAHALRNNEDRPPWPNIVDTLDREFWYGGTKGLARSQAASAELYDLEEQKMTVHIPTWERAAAGQPDALLLIQERCESDVLCHIQLYKTLVKEAS